MTLMGHPPDRNARILLRAVTRRFAIGLLSTTVSLPLHAVLSGVIVGILISLPDSFGLHSYAGVRGTRLIFGVLLVRRSPSHKSLGAKAPAVTLRRDEGVPQGARSSANSGRDFPRVLVYMLSFTTLVSSGSGNKPD